MAIILIVGRFYFPWVKRLIDEISIFLFGDHGRVVSDFLLSSFLFALPLVADDTSKSDVCRI